MEVDTTLSSIPSEAPSSAPLVETEIKVPSENMNEIDNSKTNDGPENESVSENSVTEKDKQPNEVESDKMEISTFPQESPIAESLTNGEILSPTQMRKRNRSRDDLSLSPDLTKTGKRQRKSNSYFSGFALDKKTTHAISGQENRGEETNESTLSPITSPTPISPSASTTPGSPSENKSLSVGKKEVLLTPQDAQVKAKKLPKGYAYEPITIHIPRGQLLPAKRERKKVALADYVEVEKQPIQITKTPKKQKIHKTKKHNKKQSPQQPQQPQQQTNSNEEVSLQLLKKQELENQLTVLTQQLAMVSQTLETKTKQVQALEKLEKVESPVESKEEKIEQPATSKVESIEGTVEEYALPSGTIIKRVNKKQLQTKK